MTRSSIRGLAKRHAVLPAGRPQTPAARVPSIEDVLRAALFMEKGPAGEAWVHHPHKRVRDDMLRRGLVEEYRVTPGDRPHLRITAAGREAVA